MEGKGSAGNSSATAMGGVEQENFCDTNQLILQQVEWWRGRGAPGTAAPPVWEAANRRSFVIISADSIQVEWWRGSGALGTAAPPV